MKKKICMILVAVFVAVLGTSTYFIIDHHKESNKQAALYGELADLVNAAAQTDAATEPAEQIPYSEEKMLLPELAELYQQNGDLVGWISISDTNINYPVMQSVNEPNFYLKHGFDKEYSDYGCPYVQEDCDVQEPSDNLVIYGHHFLSLLIVGVIQPCQYLTEDTPDFIDPLPNVINFSFIDRALLMKALRHLIDVVRQVLQQADGLSDFRKIQLQHITVQDHSPEEGGLVSDSEELHLLLNHFVLRFCRDEAVVNRVICLRHAHYRSMPFFLQLCRRDKSTISSSGFTMGFSPKAAEIFSTA